LSDQAFKYGDGKKFLGYLGTNAEPLCVDFWNFLKCHVLVNCLTSC
jgi:hypothetical protein